jgi:DNA processing protein
LAADPAAPALVFVAGRLDALDGPAVAIVGTRNATRAGRELAADLGHDLAAAGVAVVSGLALGIDGAAHRGALRGGPWPGLPIGVVAGGLDIAYPRRHVDLHRDVAARGLLLSETPLGVRPTPWRFPARNRIIAALSAAVVVVESRATGGSMLTAGEALDRGVPVLAVPGHPSAPASVGTNELLFDGANMVRDVRDVLDVLGIDEPAGGAAGDRSRPPLPADPAQRALLVALDGEPLALAEIVQRVDLGLEAVSAGLSALEAQGWVVRTGSWYEAAGSPRGPAS